MSTPDPMEGMNEVKASFNNLRFGKVGDWFRGTLIDNTRQMKNNLSEKGEMQTVYEFIGKGGSFHNIVDKVVDDQPTPIIDGEVWSYITGKPALLNQLKKAQLGQIVGLRFTEEVPSKKKGYNPAKIIAVYIGEMDPEYQGQSGADMR